MATAPILVRRFSKAAGADADFALTQVAPAAALLRPVGAVRTIAVQFVPYTATDTVSTGTLDLQCVTVNTPALTNTGAQPANLIAGSTINTTVAVGEVATFDVSGAGSYMIRVAAEALAVATTYALIYVRPVE